MSKPGIFLQAVIVLALSVPFPETAGAQAQTTPAAGKRSLTYAIDGKSKSGDPSNAYILEQFGEKSLYIHARDGKEEVALTINARKLGKLPVTLRISDSAKAQPDFVAVYYPEGNFKPFYQGRTGSVTVTKYDEAGKTVSGTFEFSAVFFENYREVAGKTLKISQGKFENVAFRTQVK